MSTQTTHQVKSGDTLYSLAKKYGTTVDKLKSLNGLKSDTIKVGQVLKVSDSTSTVTPPTSTTSSETKNWIIAESINLLGGADSNSSIGRKLPPKFYSQYDALYILSKEQLLNKFIDLVEWTSMGDAEEFTRALVHKFGTNKDYNINNTYSHPKLIELIRNSNGFKQYVSDISKVIKEKIVINNGKVEQKLILTEYKNFNFKEENTNLYKTGLGIAINQVSHVQVEVNDIIYHNSKPSKLKTTFIIYDTFGIDDEDMEKYGLLDVRKKDAIISYEKRNAFQQFVSTLFGWNFNCWWALQFYHGCIPFIVKVRVNNVEINL